MADLPIPTRETERLLAIALLRVEQAERERDEARELALTRGDDAISRALERDEALKAVNAMSVCHQMAERDLRETQAALAVLREAANCCWATSTWHDRKAADALADALAATPATLAGQVHAQVLREAPAAIPTDLHASCPTWPAEWLRARADEAEKAR